MFGSCCEEQEAKEAEARSRIRAATEINESRMMRGHRVREELKRALHCGDPCCAHLDCQACEEDDEPAPVVATETQASESEDDDFFDDEDEALMAKMRAARMGQMQAAVQDHEAGHTKGPPPRGFVCPHPGCDFASKTSSKEVWDHAEAEHPGIERDLGLCLWEGCGFGRKTPTMYTKHEPTHTGVWPAYCPTCKKGFDHHCTRTSHEHLARSSAHL